MGLFNTLMSKIFSHAPSSGQTGTAQPATSGAGQPGTGTGSGAQASMPMASTSATAVAGAQPSSAPPAQQVDVAAVLNGLAAKNPEKLDWRHSIVDLMKLVGMDSSLSARKELAEDLHFTGDKNDSASMNIWLHKEVLKKLSQNGGKVPPELLKK